MSKKTKTVQAARLGTACTAESNGGWSQRDFRFIASVPESHRHDVRASDHAHSRSGRSRPDPSEN